MRTSGTWKTLAFWTLLVTSISTVCSAVEITRMTVLAGDPCNSGTRDGGKGVALLGQVGAVAIDPAGKQAFISDSNTIRRVSLSDGYVTTVAGIVGRSGYQDGAAQDALFNGISDLVQTPAGDLLIADFGNRAVRSLSPWGVVSTVFVTAVSPSAIDIAPSGDIYMLDQLHAEVWVHTTSGTEIRVAGDRGQSRTIRDGYGTAATFGATQHLRVGDDGTVYVTDTCTVRAIAPTATRRVSVFAGLAGGECFSAVEAGSPSAARFDNPTGLAFASGDLYVADTGNHVIQKIAKSGRVTALDIRTVSGQPVQPNNFIRIEVTSDKQLFVADWQMAPFSDDCFSGSVLLRSLGFKRRAVHH